MADAEAVALASWLAVEMCGTTRKVRMKLTIFDIYGRYFNVLAIHFIDRTGHTGYSTVLVPDHVEINEHDVALRLGQSQMGVGSSFGNAKPSFGVITLGVIEQDIDPLLHKATFRLRYERARFEPGGPEEIVVSAESVPEPRIVDALRLLFSLDTTRMAELGAGL